MDLNILKIKKTENSCEYEVFLEDAEENSNILEKKNDMSFFKDDTLTNVKKGDEIYLLDTFGETNAFSKPTLTKEFNEAKSIMEKISNQYVKNNGETSKKIVNNVCIDHNTYSDHHIKSFEKNIEVANHHLIIAIHKVRVH